MRHVMMSRPGGMPSGTRATRRFDSVTEGDSRDSCPPKVVTKRHESSTGVVRDLPDLKIKLRIDVTWCVSVK